MPYIREEDRIAVITRGPIISGELNYVITKLAIKFKDTPMTLRVFIKKSILQYLGERQSYTLFNEVMGVLECARFEYLRRMGYDLLVNESFLALEKWLYFDIIAPYEDKKKEENGDVY